MLLTNRFNQIDSQINQVESDIAKLQTQLSELQQHRQHLQSVEQACESALTQTETALAMLNHVDPDCVQTFKAAMLAKFDGAIAALPEVTDTDTDTDTDTAPTPAPDTDSPIDVTSTPATDTDTATATEPRPLASVGSAAFNPSEATMDDLKRYVRGHWNDEQTKRQGTLTRRATWEYAAKIILQNLNSQQVSDT
jgi:TolA-binding protein